MIEFEDEDGVRVQIDPDTPIAFWASGGGFRIETSAEDFFKKFKPCIEVRPYGPVLVSIDGGAPYRAYSDGSRWNGWAMPSFTPCEMQRMANANTNTYGEFEYDPEFKTWTARVEGVDELETWKLHTIWVEGEGWVDVFDVGAGAWCWELDETEMKPYFKTPITSKAGAHAFFDQLNADGLLFHPEDSPESIVGADGGPLFTPAECVEMRRRIQEVYEFDDDPCGHCLDLINATKPEPRTIPCSISGGILTMEDGTTINLLKIQVACNAAFQQLGDPEFAEAANELAKMTGKVQGPHGEWLDNED